MMRRLVVGMGVLVCGCLGPFVTAARGTQNVDGEAAEGERLAVVVGVNLYREGQGLPPLSFAEKDIDDLEARLISSGYRVTKLTDGAARERPTNSPTALNIRDALRRIVGNRVLEEQDTVLVAFAGHGVQLAVRDDPNGAAETKYFFCPTDADLKPILDRIARNDLPTTDDVEHRHHLISIDELYSNLAEYDDAKQTGCGAGLRFLLIDTCRNDPTKPSPTRSSNSVTFPQLPPPPGGLLALYGCQPSQLSYEDPTLEHGVFFHFVIEGLEGPADLDKDGEVAVTELVHFVQRQVSLHVADKLRGEQNPVFATPSSTLGPTGIVSLGRFPIGSEPGELREFTSLPEFRMAWIPAGRFTMGSPVTEAGRYVNEDQVEVELTQGFWLGETEVTQAQWHSLMGNKPWKDQRNVKEGDRYPATYVSWEEAVEFCRRLTDQERREGRLSSQSEYRLPTEAEWEYACRAGSLTAYSFGDAAAGLEDHCWFRGNVLGTREKYAHAVGQKLPNGWNLRDMHGNCFEWCMSEYSDDTRDQVASERPANTARVIRGGSWGEPAANCRSSHRGGFIASRRYGVVTFRVVSASVSE